jgi:hypothetical protein
MELMLLFLWLLEILWRQIAKTTVLDAMEWFMEVGKKFYHLGFAKDGDKF